ncbi:MAG: hypothetical protein U0930_17730 [Pirellulales bacterium]
MGLDYHFHLQHFDGDIWKTPLEFDDPTDRVTHGELTWFDDKDVTILRLFVLDEAIFPLDRNEPPNFDITRLYRLTNRTPDMTDDDVMEHIRNCFDEAYVGWIGFSDLCIDLWPETEVLVQKTVPSSMAPVFGDGLQPFPYKKLITEGWSTIEVENMKTTSDYAPDVKFFADGYRLVKSPMSAQSTVANGKTALVTWKVTLAEFVGDWRMTQLHAARKLDGDDRLRIICTYS